VRGKVINAPSLGRLAYDDAEGWYEGEVEVTPRRSAHLFIEPGGVDVAAAALARLRQNEAQLRHAAAEELAANDPPCVAPLTVEQVADALWVGSVYFWEDGGACVDWDADVPDDYPNLLDWSSASWVSHIDASGRCTKVAWEND
jgi:hypothetical protein